MRPLAGEQRFRSRPLATALAIGIAGALAAAALSAPAAPPAPASRAWLLRVKEPAQLDVTIAQARFRLPPRAPRPRMRVRVAGPTGLDFVAAARFLARPRQAVPVLIVVVNRRPVGSAAPDLDRVELSVRLSRALRGPRYAEIVDVYARSTPAARAARVCDVGGQAALRRWDLRLMTRAGRPPSGFGARETIAQAFNQACGRAVDPRFRAAVQGRPAPEPAPLPPPSPPEPVPPPISPPAPPPPSCDPCPPTAGGTPCPQTVPPCPDPYQRRR